MQVVDVVEQVRDVGIDVTAYESMRAPPSSLGARHLTTTRAPTRVAVTRRGALAIMYGDVEEELVKNSLVACVAS